MGNAFKDYQMTESNLFYFYERLLRTIKYARYNFMAHRFFLQSVGLVYDALWSTEKDNCSAMTFWVCFRDQRFISIIEL